MRVGGRKRVQLAADAEELLVVRVHRVLRRALALLDDRAEGLERGLQADDRARAAQAHFIGRELQGAVAGKGDRLAVARDEGLQPLPECCVEIPDGVVVEAHRRQAAATPATGIGALVGKAGAIGLGRAVRALEEHKVLQRLGIEGRELHRHARRQVTRIKREIGAPDARCPAQRRGDIPHGRQVSHLVDRHRQEHLLPAPHGGGLRRTESLARPVLEADGRVQVGTHEVVLKLGCLVEGMQQHLTLQERAVGRGIVHETSQDRLWLAR